MNIEDSLISLPISTKSHSLARSLASQHSIPSVVERVRRNTLAVLIIHDYLEMMGIASNLDSGDCWNPFVQICADIADLEIEGRGKLECRSLLAGELVCYVPAEVWVDRIGYVVVQFNQDWRSASILGFVPQVSTESLAIDRLEPIENLLEAIYNLQQSPQNFSDNNLDITTISNKTISNLSNWIRDVFELGWQELENLLDGKQSRYAYRTREISTSLKNNASNLTELRRGKLIDLGCEMSRSLVCLIITISQISEFEMGIRIALYPISNILLPEFLKLIVLDDAENIFLQAQARSIDNYIQLQFSGNIGERFSVQVSLAETYVIESFLI
jgi:hypothetical protein